MTATSSPFNLCFPALVILVREITMTLFNSSSEKINTYHRLVIGLDGIMRVSDGTRSWPASALAMALLPRPTHRIVTSHEEVSHHG
jgi:hypothetical protein